MIGKSTAQFWVSLLSLIQPRWSSASSTESAMTLVFLVSNSLFSLEAVSYTHLDVYKRQSLERVEVLKGANAMLYGNVAPGGIINLITKKPRFNFGGSVALNGGSWNTYKPVSYTHLDVYKRQPLNSGIFHRKV